MREVQLMRRTINRILVAVAVIGLVLLGRGVAGASPSRVSVLAGQRATVACAGGTLSVSPESNSRITVSCSGGPTSGRATTVTLAPRFFATDWWSLPTGQVSWQWVLNHPFNLHSSRDMGKDDFLPGGGRAAAPTVYDIDGIVNPKSTVAALHAKRNRVICYVEAGSAGNYYSASQEGIATSYYDQLQAAADLGNTLPGYPAERFVDIRAASSVRIVEAMIRQQCSVKRFDAVETDLDETYTGYDGLTGFPLTKANERTFDTTLAKYIHSLRMGWIAKNLVDTGDNFATIMEPYADGLLTEDCNQWRQCGQAAHYIAHGKGVLNAEYHLSTSQFCRADNAARIDGAHLDTGVDGYRQPCR
jgi:hypothetical protein